MFGFLLKRLPAVSKPAVSFLTPGRWLSTMPITGAYQPSFREMPLSFINKSPEMLETSKIQILDKTQLIEEIKTDSVMRKRRLKMKKHKLRKRRKAQRALRQKLNK